MEENKQVKQEEETKGTTQGEEEEKKKEEKKKEEKKKKVHWEFDSINSVMYVSQAKSNLAQLEARFKFKLVIYKDKDTHIESMKITNYVIDKQIVAAEKWENAAGRTALLLLLLLICRRT